MFKKILKVINKSLLGTDFLQKIQSTSTSPFMFVLGLVLMILLQWPIGIRQNLCDPILKCHRWKKDCLAQNCFGENTTCHFQIQGHGGLPVRFLQSEEHTSELQ